MCGRGESFRQGGAQFPRVQESIDKLIGGSFASFIIFIAFYWSSLGETYRLDVIMNIASSDGFISKT